jgi:RHS repeat-associated protein
MTGTRYRRTAVLGFALLAGSALTAPAVAQTGQPPHRAIDANGVDLISGTYPLQLTEGTIGTGLGAITLERQGTGGGIGNWQNMYVQRAVSGSTTTAVVVLGDHSETFTYNGTSYTPNQANGARLTGGDHADFAYVGSDGTVIVFGAGTEDRNGASNLCSHSNSNLTSCFAVPTSLTKPNGLTFTFEWDVHANCSTTFNPDGSRDCTFAWRLDTVANSFGNSVDFAYNPVVVSMYQNPGPTWYQRTGATLSNGTVTRTVDNNFVSSTATEVTDANGRVWTITDGTTTLGIQRPGSGSDDITVTFSGGAVSQVVRDGIATAYSRSVASNIATTTITDAESHVSTVVANTSTGRITSVTALGHQTQYQYDSSGRLEKVTEPDGNYTFYTHDSRGNVTEVRRVAKPGTNLPDIVTSADYEPSCAHVWCNQPRTTTDERGNVTEYTYDDTHGGVTIVTAPAPSGSGTRPQTRYSYTLTNGEYRLTGISACATGSAPSCLGTADETRTVIAYGTDGNVASVQRRDGTGGLSATTAYAYSQLGDLETVDGPLSGTADTTRYRYDTARQLVGVIGPDPDGSGARRHQAQRITYDSGGRATLVEFGTVASQSDSDWAAIDVEYQTEQVYDSADHYRPTVRRLVSGTTVHALTQTNYDSLGRVLCVAQRMNPSEFASLPSDACTLDTTGGHGPDRITQTTYDALDRPLLVQTGVGVTGQTADEVATAYTANGRVNHVTDAEGNRTTYEYDGHDRLLNTRYPSPTTDGVSAPTSGAGNDYEQLTYATATVDLSPVSTSLVSSRRLRNGNSIAYAYDALGRLTSKDPSASSELTVSYTYDLLGRMTGASQTGQALTFAWDALGRMTSAGTQLGGTTRTLTYEYDLAGRRTRITHPDSAYFTYGRDVLGRPTLIREGGVNWLNGFSYTDMGAVSDQSYNAASLTTYGASSYGYNDLGQLTATTHNLAGTGDDLQSSFLYNPASQIASQTRSDNDYAWQRHYGATRSYTTNGLNQYTATASTTSAGSGSSTLSYNTAGNLSGASWTSSSGSGSRTYTYDSENRLVSANGGTSATLAYDPLGRLSEITAGSTTTRFLYDGDALVAEYDGSNAMTRRYVHGDGADTPEVSYTGSSLSSPNFLVADERGSVIAVTDAAGNALAINSYDEYGIPGASNSGRFQYTGQTWLPELGVYYYKARLYSPYLGRFFQTDPIGFRGGMNIYGYVLNDPVNFSDPSGFQRTADPPEGQYCLRSPQRVERCFTTREAFMAAVAEDQKGTVTGGWGNGDVSFSCCDIGRFFMGLGIDVFHFTFHIPWARSEPIPTYQDAFNRCVAQHGDGCDPYSPTGRRGP